MAVCGCGFCGYQIRYHGEPEGEYPVEHVFCPIKNWRALEDENLPADSLEIEHDGIFFYAWRCARCGTFTFFNDDWKCIGTYTPKDEFSSAPMCGLKLPRATITVPPKFSQNFPATSGLQKMITSCAFTRTRRGQNV